MQAEDHPIANTNYKNNEQATQLNFKTIQKQKGGLAEFMFSFFEKALSDLIVDIKVIPEKESTNSPLWKGGI